MREPGFYWVKITDAFEVAYFNGEKWMLVGLHHEYHENTFAEIDERRIVRDELCKDELLTVAYLADLHPGLTYDLTKDLLAFSKSKTITHKSCYGDGSIIYKLWKDQLPK